MSHKNKLSLVDQVIEVLKNQLQIGSSRHEAKKRGDSFSHIYSWESYRTYLKFSCYFVLWCKEHYHCKTLKQCRSHVDEWLSSLSELSPSTQKTYACAVGKLYQCPTTDFQQTPNRTRATITRSRGTKIRDRHFSEKSNQEFVSFCKSTGLRRSEIRCLKGSDLCFEDGTYYIHVTRGSKGGKPRYAPVIGDIALVVKRMNQSGDQKVWNKIFEGADIHSYRADYASSLYQSLARSKEKIPVCERYCCRKDQKGIWLDKQAMKETSKALGHNRISIIAEHYLHL